MTTDFEESFKAKLRAAAREKKRDPADLWQGLMLERFLVRLSRSPYCRQFVLKGGILLAKYVDIGRETRDLDFLARSSSNEIGYLQELFGKIAEIDLRDGFSFRKVVANELIHPHMKYSGATVTMTAHFGRTRFKVSIDIGFGDIVDPIEKSLPLTTYSKGPLFESDVELSCYPKEFIFAEKLETVIYRGAFNSRMKDFHDLYSLIMASKELKFQNLESIILAVFEHRDTALVLPISYNDDTSVNRMQGYWNIYLKSLREQELKKLPIHIGQILDALNDWLITSIKLEPSTKD